MNSRYRFVPATLWLCLIWTLSSLPSEDIPTLKIIGFDKLMHVGVYVVLIILVWMGFKGKRLSISHRVLITSILVLLATADEYHQYYIPGRSVSVYDLLANTLGLVVGSIIGTLLYDRS